MKTCLSCMTTTRNNDLEKCNVCGSTNFRAGRPKTGYKMDPTEVVDNEDTEDIIAKPNMQAVTHEEHMEIHHGEQAIDYSQYNDDITLGKWICTILLLLVPIVGIVYAIVKIIRKKENITYTNYLKAQLIIMAISAVIGFLFSGIIVNALVNMLYYMY